MALTKADKLFKEFQSDCAAAQAACTKRIIRAKAAYDAAVKALPLKPSKKVKGNAKRTS